MPLESASFINELVSANPPGSDPTAEGDDQIRLIKSALQGTFPNFTGALTATNAVLNAIDGRATTLETEAIRENGSNPFTGNQSMGSNQLTNVANGTTNDAAVNLGQLNAVAAQATAALQAQYPVGALLMNTTGANPNSYLGFGTWQSFGEGRVLIGSGGGQVLGSTGGSNTQSVPLPAHTHGIFASEAGGPQNGITNRNQTTQLGSSTGNDFSYLPVQASVPVTGSFLGSTSQEGSAGASVDVRQPFITVAIFRRSA